MTGDQEQHNQQPQRDSRSTPRRAVLVIVIVVLLACSACGLAFQHTSSAQEVAIKFCDDLESGDTGATHDLLSDRAKHAISESDLARNSHENSGFECETASKTLSNFNHFCDGSEVIGLTNARISVCWLSLSGVLSSTTIEGTIYLVFEHFAWRVDRIDRQNYRIV